MIIFYDISFFFFKENHIFQTIRHFLSIMCFRNLFSFISLMTKVSHVQIYLNIFYHFYDTVSHHTVILIHTFCVHLHLYNTSHTYLSRAVEIGQKAFDLRRLHSMMSSNGYLLALYREFLINCEVKETGFSIFLKRQQSFLF